MRTLRALLSTVLAVSVVLGQIAPLVGTSPAVASATPSARSSTVAARHRVAKPARPKPIEKKTSVLRSLARAKKIESGAWTVGLQSAADAGRVVAALKAKGVRVTRSTLKGRLLEFKGSEARALAAAQVVDDIAGVRYVEPVTVMEAAYVPSDSDYPSEWGMPHVKAPQAWDLTLGSPDVVIAVVDTGVQLSNTDLRIDTANDWDFVNNDNMAEDDYGHGTHVAGIAAAMANNQTVIGVAPGCTILPIKVLSDAGYGWSSDVAAGIVWAADHGADVINLSLGGSTVSSDVYDAVNYAMSKDCVVVAAAGNSSTSTPSYPAACPGVLAVSAIDSTDHLASFSNYGSWIDVAAPGVDVASLWPFEGGPVARLSGTSMASPFVAGAAALVRAWNPQLTQAQIVERITANASDIGAPGKDDSFGCGLLNVAAAMANDATAPAVTLTNPVNGAIVRGQVPLTVSCSDSGSGVAHVDYSVDGTLVASVKSAPFSAVWNSVPYMSGTHLVEARAWDYGGNCTTTAATVTLVPDASTGGTATGPASWFGGTPQPGSVTTSVRPLIWISVVEAAVISPSPYFSMKLDGVTQSPSITWDSTDHTRATLTFTPRADLSAGQHTVKYSIRNNAGTYSTYTWTFTVAMTADVTAPLVAFTAPAEGAVVSGQVPVAASASDAESGVAKVDFKADGVLVGSATAAPYSVTWNAASATPGTHTLSATAFDAMGNAATVTRTVTVVAPDVTGPSATILTPADGASVGKGMVRVSVDASDSGSGVDRVEFWQAGYLRSTVRTTPYVWDWDTAVASMGPNVITVKAYDRVGNVTVKSVTVNVPDVVGPGFLISTPTEGAVCYGIVDLTCSAIDTQSGVDHVEWYVDGVEVASVSSAPYSAVWDTKGWAPGAHVVSGIAYDKAGNYGSWYNNVTVPQPDSAPPTVKITSPTDGATLQAGMIAVSADATDTGAGVGRVEFLVDGVVIATSKSAPYSFSWNASGASLGSHTVAARATDLSGNAALASISVNLIAAGTFSGPAAWSAPSPAANATVTNLRPTISISASDPATISGSPYYSLKLDGASQIPTVAWNSPDHKSATLTFAPRVDLSAGAHTVKATIRNDAGTYSSYQWSFCVADLSDKTPPVVSFTAPANGATVSGSVALAANATDAGSGVASVEFRVDGSPVGSAASAPYGATWNAASAAPGAHVLTATAVDKSGNSATATITVNVPVPDTSAPTLSLTSPLEGAIVSGAVPIVAAASDNVGVSKVEFLVDGTLLGSATSAPFTWTWDSTNAVPGAHVIQAIAYDAAGNVTSKTVHVTVPDVAAPTVSIVTPSSGALVTSATQISVAATDTGSGVDHVDVSVDGTLLGSFSAAPYAAMWDAPKAGEGSHTITARAVDKAGNVTTTSIVVTVPAPDTTPPVIASVSPSDGAAVQSGIVALGAIADDAGWGIATVDFRVDGTLVGSDDKAPYSVNWDASQASVGAHTLEVRATDRAGNVATSSVTFTLTAAGTATGPARWWSAFPVHSSTVTAPRPTLSVNVSDPTIISGSPYYSLKVDGALQTPSIAWTAADHTSASLSFVPRVDLAAGLHTVKYSVRNNAGAYSTYTWSFTVIDTSDKTAPTVAITSPTEGAVVRDLVSVSADASDAGSGVAKVEFRLDGTTTIGTSVAAPYATTWNAATAAPGAHVLAAVATDKSGNTATATVNVVVPAPDTAAPSAAIVSPADGASVAGTVSVSAEATDSETGVSRVEFAVDGVRAATVSSAPYVFAWDTSSVVAGSHSLTVTAFDKAGNSKSASMNVTVCDVIAPSVTILSPSAGATVWAPQTLSAIGSDVGSGIARIDFAVDGVVVGGVAGSPAQVEWNPGSVTPGTHVISATAIDGSGNVATASVLVSVPMPDTTAPTVRILSPADGASVTAGTVQISATATDTGGWGVSKLDLLIDGVSQGTSTNPQSASWTWSASAAALGGHVIEVRATDFAGNVGSATATINLIAAGVSTGPASWSNATPTHGSTTTAVRPLIAVAASDPAIISGSPYYSLKVDGVTQIPTIVWNAVDHSSATLSFTPKVDLTPGAHTVKYSVRNNAGTYSTITWSFTVTN